MVIIHPSAAKSAADIAALQLATGRRAVRGNTYARLVRPNEPKKTASKKNPNNNPTDWDGGNAA